MSNLSKVAEDVKSLAKKFQAILDLGAALDEVGSIEQAKRDADIAKENAYKEAEAAKLSALKAKEALEAAQGKVLMAEKEAVEIVEKANSKYSEIIASAKFKVEEVMVEGEEKRLAISNKLNDAYNSFALVQADIIAKQNELEDLKSQISSIKSKLQAFVGV